MGVRKALFALCAGAALAMPALACDDSLRGPEDFLDGTWSAEVTRVRAFDTPEADRIPVTMSSSTSSLAMDWALGPPIKFDHVTGPSPDTFLAFAPRRSKVAIMLGPLITASNKVILEQQCEIRNDHYYFSDQASGTAEDDTRSFILPLNRSLAIGATYRLGSDGTLTHKSSEFALFILHKNAN